MTAYELFEKLALVTWRSISLCHSKQIRLGEDAVTSTNLINLAVKGPASIAVEDTRPNESTKGCDFELWIGSDRFGWSRYAVQAKKIDVNSSRYPSLAHMVGGAAQIDILDAYAKANSAAAIYCFYNYSTEKHGWNCNLPRDTEQLGCSVTPSSVVRKAITTRGARSFTAIHSRAETLPWRCLVRCPHLVPSGAPGHRGWPAPRSFRHERLPEILQVLRRERSSKAILDLGEVVSRDLSLRPEWIAVIDISDESHRG